MTQITVTGLTEATLTGSGIFDVLMRANKVHLEEEFLKNRIKGPEYAQVYLGSMDSVMKAAMEFLLQQQKTSLEADLMAQQILVAQQEVLKSTAQVAQITAQTALVTQQKANLLAEAANIIKQGALLDAQICKATAEFDLTVSNTLKSTKESDLLIQKTATEKAQVLALGVDDNSVLGKQKLLYAAQTNGFTRDAEQKVAKLMVDSWNVRKTVDSATNPDPAGLSDAAIAATITKLRNGIGA